MVMRDQSKIPARTKLDEILALQCGEWIAASETGSVACTQTELDRLAQPPVGLDIIERRTVIQIAPEGGDEIGRLSIVEGQAVRAAAMSTSCRSSTVPRGCGRWRGL